MHEPAVAILARRVAASDNNERPSTVSRRNLHILNRGKCIFITGEGGIRRRDRVCAFSVTRGIPLFPRLYVHAHTCIREHSSLVGRGREKEREREIWASLSDDSMPRVDPRIIVIIIIIIIIIIANEQALIGGDR